MNGIQCSHSNHNCFWCICVQHIENSFHSLSSIDFALFLLNLFYMVFKFLYTYTLRAVHFFPIVPSNLLNETPLALMCCVSVEIICCIHQCMGYKQKCTVRPKHFIARLYFSKSKWKIKSCTEWKKTEHKNWMPTAWVKICIVLIENRGIAQNS